MKDGYVGEAVITASTGNVGIPQDATPTDVNVPISAPALENEDLIARYREEFARLMTGSRPGLNPTTQIRS